MNSSLLPPGSSVLEHRLTATCADISKMDVGLRSLWNPEQCPMTFLPYLAWAFSVDRWEESWPEEVKRKTIADAFWIHQRKGTVAAMQRVIEAAGYSMLLDEWWLIGDSPGTFRLTIELKDVGITEAMVPELERIIDDTKPVSRHISQLTLLTRSNGTMFIGCAITDGEEITVYPSWYKTECCIEYSGNGYYDGNYKYCTSNGGQRGFVTYDGSIRYDGQQHYDGIYHLRNI